jgi:hypothetical protein
VVAVIRNPDMGIAGVDQPAVAEIPYVAGDHVIPYYLTFHTPVILPSGGWSLVMTANRVDWSENDLLIPGKVDNQIGISATPYTAARQAQCLPTIDGLPVPIRRIIAGGVAVSINNGYVSNNQYGGFEVQANTQYQLVYLAPYTTQGLVFTASLAPHSTSGYGDANLVYSHGSMAAGVILSLIFGGAIGAYIVHWRNQKRVQSGFNQVYVKHSRHFLLSLLFSLPLLCYVDDLYSDETSHLARINQIDA